jgi:hypothetical protein
MMNQGTWIPGEGWMTFGRQPQMVIEDFVAAHDPNEPINSPYFVPVPLVPVEVPVVMPVEPEPAQPPRKAIDVAADWLREALALDPLPATQIAAMAENASIKPRTLRRAFQKIGAQTFKRSDAWWWQLPGAEDDRQKGGRLPARIRRKRP